MRLVGEPILAAVRHRRESVLLHALSKIKKRCAHASGKAGVWIPNDAKKHGGELRDVQPPS
jgi:hypothetical protein